MLTVKSFVNRFCFCFSIKIGKFADCSLQKKDISKFLFQILTLKDNPHAKFELELPILEFLEYLVSFLQLLNNAMACSTEAIFNLWVRKERKLYHIWYHWYEAILTHTRTRQLKFKLSSRSSKLSFKIKTCFEKCFFFDKIFFSK